MKIDIEKVLAIMGGHDTVPDDWMPATGMRPLQQDDPGLLWLRFHGEDEGFEKDTSSFAFTPYISRKGQEFESAWILKEAPRAVRAMEEDWNVRQVGSLRRTLELMEQRVPVIAKAALWNKEEKIYGSADLICLESWLYKKFKHLRPENYEYKEASDKYTIIDMKYTSGLHTYSKRDDLEKYACQLNIYAYALAHMQNAVMKTVYIVSRDRVRTPIPIDTTVALSKPLDKKLRDYRNEFRRIKLRGDRVKPWSDVPNAPAVNPQNSEDFPFHGAKEIILTELIKGQSLTMLPGVGNTLANALEDAGFECVSDMLKMKPEDIPFEDIPGFGPANSARVRAVLQANRSKKATKIPIDVVPPKAATELFVDYEYLSNVNCDMEKEWPVLTGTPMVAMIGVAWRENGRLRKEVFRAESESHSAELKMFRSFVALLESKKVLDENRTAALYCWGDAERAQTLQAIERHPRALKVLANLPWYDLLDKVMHAVPVVIPGMWSFGLKPTATALSAYSEKHAMSWPDGGLSSGQAAQVALWECYRQPKPDEHEAWALTASYLKSDLEALDCVLRWVRDCTKEDLQRSVKSAQGSWYRMAVGGNCNPVARMESMYTPRWYTARTNKDNSPTHA